jgi:hypothetical protein
MTRLLALLCALAFAFMAAAPAGAASVPDRVEELQQELDSLTEDVEDLQEPVAEFERFEQCMYLIGVSEHGGRRDGYLYGQGRTRRPALAFDLGGFGRPDYRFSRSRRRRRRASSATRTRGRRTAMTTERAGCGAQDRDVV